MGKKMRMGLHLVVVIAALLFCMAEVSCADHHDYSNEKIEDHHHLTHSEPELVKGPNRRLLASVDCGARCRVRCSAHSRPKICKRACGTCCIRCKCVPPGTSGNRHVCGRCYTHMITHRNKFKCP